MDKKEQLNQILLSLLGSQHYVDTWWDSDNYNWGMRTPQEVWDSGPGGQLDVINYLLKYAQK